MRTETRASDSLNAKLLLKTLVAFKKGDFSVVVGKIILPNAALQELALGLTNGIHNLLFFRPIENR